MDGNETETATNEMKQIYPHEHSGEMTWIQPYISTKVTKPINNIRSKFRCDR